jgi:hypothetical protein
MPLLLTNTHLNQNNDDKKGPQELICTHFISDEDTLLYDPA